MDLKTYEALWPSPRYRRGHARCHDQWPIQSRDRGPARLRWRPAVPPEPGSVPGRGHAAWRRAPVLGAQDHSKRLCGHQTRCLDLRAGGLQAVRSAARCHDLQRRWRLRRPRRTDSCGRGVRHDLIVAGEMAPTIAASSLCRVSARACVTSAASNMTQRHPRRLTDALPHRRCDPVCGDRGIGLPPER